MPGCVFIAGASGAIGKRLCPILVADGWRVVGTTRTLEKAQMLSVMGVEPVIIDVFSARELSAVVENIAPDVVMHQLTDLPAGLDPEKMSEAVVRNTHIWEEGTRNLIAAAVAAGSKKFIAQSLAFVYADGPLPHVETDELNVHVIGDSAVTVRGVLSLESQVLNSPLKGIVLRYGLLYGPGTGSDAPSGPVPVHVDAAAYAAALATRAGETGIYNVAEADDQVSCDKARRELKWDAGWRLE